eukprot:33791_1
MGNTSSNADAINEEFLLAVKKGEIDKVKQMCLNANNDVAFNINYRDKSLQTPIMWACSMGHIQIIDLLMSFGANLTDCDKDKYTALHYAVTEKKPDVVKLLVVNYKSKININAKNNQGDTALHRSIHYSDKQISSLLITNGANINALNNVQETPLDKARTNEIKIWLKSLGGKNNAKKAIIEGGNINNDEKKDNKLSEDDKQYIRKITPKNIDTNESKSVINLDITDNSFSELSGNMKKKPEISGNTAQNQEQNQEFSGNTHTLNMLPDEDENEAEVMKQLEDDIKQIETENAKNLQAANVINVIESDGSDAGTLLNATIIDDDNIIESDDSMSGNMNGGNKKNDIETESLVVGAPLHKDSDGTIILNKPANSAPPVDRSDNMISNISGNKDECIHQSLSQINKNDIINMSELELNVKKNKEIVYMSNDSTPSSPIVIKLSNTDEVNVVEQYFSANKKNIYDTKDSQKETDNKTNEIHHAKRHRGTIIMPPEDDNENENNQIETENRIAQSLDIVFNNDNNADSDEDKPYDYDETWMNKNNNKNAFNVVLLSPYKSLRKSFLKFCFE